MIKATEALKQTKKALKNREKRTMEWAFNEAEAYIDPQIRKAIVEYKMQTSYFWSAGIFKEADIDVHEAIDMIIEYLIEHGYTVKPLFNYTKEDSVKIIIYWENPTDTEIIEE